MTKGAQTLRNWRKLQKPAVTLEKLCELMLQHDPALRVSIMNLSRWERAERDPSLAIMTALDQMDIVPVAYWTQAPEDEGALPSLSEAS